MTFLDRIKETSTSTGTGAFTLGGAVLGYKVFSNGTYKYCIVNETESEWEVGEGTVASGVLTRTTIEASSNGGAAVVFTAGTKYVFNTVSATYVNSLVSYTGATASVNLGAYNITATNIIRAGGLSTEFLKADGSVDSTTYMNRAVYDTDGNGVVDAAEKMQTIGRNSTGVTLYKGTIVYISGSTGNRPNFVKAQANSEATSAGTFGVVVSDIANNSDGYVATIGTLADLDTRTTATNPFTSVTLADGDTIYLDPNTAGYITNVKPSAPNHIVYVGKVVRTSPTLGTIVYRIQNGYELSEIHDISISSVANNDVLVYESSSTLWKNKSIATILGYTPANDSLVVHLAGAETITGVKTFQNALQTTAGNNLLNTGGGNTVIGYTADPASSVNYKLDVNGKIKSNTLFVNDGSAYSLTFNSSATNGQLLLKGSYPSLMLQSGAGDNRLNLFNSGPGGGIQIWYGTQSNIYLDSSADGYYALGYAYGKTSAPVASAILELSSVSRGLLLPRMTTAQKTAITTPATSLLVYDTDLAAFQYYTGSAWAGLGGITGSGTAGQVTYWNGTSAVTGSSNLFWDNTNGRLGIGTSSPNSLLHVSKNQNSQTAINISNSTAGTGSNVSFNLNSDSGGSSFAKNSSLVTSYKISTPNDAVIYNSISGDITIFNDWASGKLKFAGGGVSTSQMTLFSNGNLSINNGVTDGGQRLQVIGSMRVGSTAASAMYWDDTNNRLGIGVSSPNSSLHVVGAGNTNATNSLTIQNNSGSNLFNINNVAEIIIGNSTISSGNRIFFDFPLTYGGDFTSRIATTEAMSFGFNAQAAFGGTANNISGRTIYFYDRVGGVFLGGINPTNGFYIGQSTTRYGLNVQPANTGITAMTIKSNGRINMSSLPTSSAGLSAGDLWNNLGIINIV